jgi:hypothetical protein
MSATGFFAFLSILMIISPLVWQPFQPMSTAMLRSFKITTLIAAATAVVLLSITEVPGRHTHSAGHPNTNGTRWRVSAQKPLDPAAWGTDHVGKPIPEFVHGDECLFCHRNDIGPGWQKNAHGLDLRQSEDAPEWKDVFKGQPSLTSVAPQSNTFLAAAIVCVS